MISEAIKIGESLNNMNEKNVQSAHNRRMEKQNNQFSMFSKVISDNQMHARAMDEMEKSHKFNMAKIKAEENITIKTLDNNLLGLTNNNTTARLMAADVINGQTKIAEANNKTEQVRANSEMKAKISDNVSQAFGKMFGKR